MCLWPPTALRLQGQNQTLQGALSTIHGMEETGRVDPSTMTTEVACSG
jgi:hypothetical protein